MFALITLLWIASGFESATALVPVNCTNTTYAEFYFQWCLADEQCQQNLHLFEDDLWSFTQMLNNELLEPMEMSAEDVCGDVIEPWWKALLRIVNLCFPNHYRDTDGLCVLRPGRLEDPEVDFRTGLSGVSSPFMLAALFAVFLWLAVHELDSWKKVQKQLELQYQKHDLLKAKPVEIKFNFAPS